MCKASDIGNLLHVDIHCMIQFLWVNCVFCIPVHSHLFNGTGDGLIQVQHVRKRCREFENCQKDIHDDDDHTDQHSTSSACVNAAEVEEVILGNKQGTWKVTSSTAMRTWKWLFLNGHKCRCLISAVMEFFNWSHIWTNSSTC
jgi:hypothetical protein